VFCALYFKIKKDYICVYFFKKCFNYKKEKNQGNDIFNDEKFVAEQLSIQYKD
jgi:hypothetical protein